MITVSGSTILFPLRNNEESLALQNGSLVKFGGRAYHRNDEGSITPELESELENTARAHPEKVIEARIYANGGTEMIITDLNVYKENREQR